MADEIIYKKMTRKADKGLEGKVVAKHGYVLSDYGKTLKQNSLNFDEGLQGQKRFSTYGDMAPLNLLEAATWEDMENNIKW